MQIMKKHPFESQRIQVLTSTGLLDSPNEQEFDELTELASYICKTPIALVSLVDSDRQWFKSKVGLEARETPREVAFCSHAILEEGLFLVADATKDLRFKDNPLVCGDPNIRFYAGIPLRCSLTQLPLGTLCVIDKVPRQLDPGQIQAMNCLRNQVERLIFLRNQISDRNSLIRQNSLITKRQNYILEGAALGAWDWWLESNQVEFDSRWFEMLGLDPKSTNQSLSTWESRVHPEDLVKCYVDIKAHLDGKVPFYENVHRMRHANGEWVWILDRGRVSEFSSNGKPIRFTGTHLDITALKRQEIVSRKIQEIAKIGGWELDMLTQKTVWSEQVYEIYGIDKSIPTDRILGLSYYAEHERVKLQKCIEQCAAGESFKCVFEFYDAKGTQKWVESSGIPSYNAEGKVTKLYGTIKDISRSIRAQKELELSRLKTHHASKMASLGQMSAGVAHEINTPLATGRAALGMLEKLRQNEQKFSEKIVFIQRSLDRIAKIVDGLRKFSRSSEVKEMEVIKASEIVASAQLLTDIRAKAASCQVNFKIESDALIFCDPVEIEQVMINLIHNAIDAAGSTELLIESINDDTIPNPWVQVLLTESKNQIVLKVVDSGPGLSAEAKERLFEPFFTTKPIGQGTGLGLSICKGILDHHEASLAVYSLDGHTCFEVRFEMYQKQKVFA